MSDAGEGRTFRVTGGNAIGGTFVPAGNKNETLPVIAAALMGDAPVLLRNRPDIADVRVMLDVASRLGASVAYTDDGALRIDPSGLCSGTLHDDLARLTRGPRVLLAALGGVFAGVLPRRRARIIPACFVAP